MKAKTKQKRLLSLLLVLMMTLTLLPATAFASGNVITHVDISDITMPVAGAAPDYTGTLPADAPYRFATAEELDAHGCSGISQNGIRWNHYVPGGLFFAGDVTYLKVALVAKDGYEFAENLTVSINGNPELGDDNYTDNKGTFAVVFSIDITVSTPPTPITSVNISDITMPAADAAPDYTGTLPADAPYRFATTDELRTLFKLGDSSIAQCQNGIGWDGVSPTDTFAAGTRTYLKAFLVAEEGYVFAEKTELTVSINGDTELGDPNYSRTYGTYCLIYSVYITVPSAPPTPITSVDISDITLPVADAAPDYTGTLPAGAPYRFATTDELITLFGYSDTISEYQNGIGWDEVSPTDTFTAGEKTFLKVALIAEDGYEFADDLTVSINGSTELVNNLWTENFGPYAAVTSITITVPSAPTPLTPITSVDISDITLPVAGATPNYTGTLPAGAPYHFATAEELNTLFGYSNGTIARIQNGLRWKNYAPGDTFSVKNYTYLCVYLVAEDGYKFADDLTVSINGSTELVDAPCTDTYDGSHLLACSISITFPPISIPAGYSGIYESDGHYYYCENGVVNASYWGLVPYGGSYWGVRGGEIDFTYTNLVEYNGAEYFIYGGQLITSIDGLFNIGTAAHSPNSGGWVLFQQGRYASDYTGLVYYYGQYYYVKNGEVDWTYYGFADLNGVPYLVISGMMYSDAHGLYNVNGTWVLVTYNRVYSEYTGYFAYGGSEYYIRNGYLDWSVPVRSA